MPGAGNPAAFDRFAYTLNNPINLVDPTGHWTCMGESNCKEIIEYWLETLKNSGDVGRGLWETFQEKDKYLKGLSLDQRGILINLGNIGDYNGAIVVLGRINIGDAFFKNYKNPENVAVFAHEYTHFKQGFTTSLSTIGEMDAYQVQYRVLKELGGSNIFLNDLNKSWKPGRFDPQDVEKSRSAMNKQFPDTSLYFNEPYFPMTWLAKPISLIQNSSAYPLEVNSADQFQKKGQQTKP